MRLQLRRPLAATAVLLAAVGTAVISVPSPALAASAPARVVSAAPAVPGPSHASASAGTGGAAVHAASAPAATTAKPDDASSPTLGETIKRIRLWQSLTSMGILVGSLVLVKRLALRR